jgi:Mrp family chromosome partitioning ATPase
MTHEEYTKQSEKILQRTRLIHRKLAVISGKGGVGKSVVTALVASALARKGYKVGILDADITGASIPKIFGVTTKPTMNQDAILPPQTKKGIKIMSMNLFLDEENQPVIWRGPLIAGAIRQFLSDIEWGELDYLLIDMPPGTSDAPLTVLQSLQLDGIIFVTSPQDLVTMIVEKTIHMAHKMNAPIVGIIENMSGLECPHCHQLIQPFGNTNIETIARKNGTILLGKIPIESEITRLCDAGKIEDHHATYIDKMISTLEKRFPKSNHVVQTSKDAKE